MTTQTKILLIMCLLLQVQPYTISVANADHLGKPKEVHANLNWIPIVEPVGLFSNGSGYWKLSAHNWFWHCTECYVMGVKWYYYADHIIAGCRYPMFSPGSIAYFILKLPDSITIDTVSNLRPESFDSENEWRNRLSELNFTIPAKWLYPDKVLKKETIYERKPWRYTTMKGLFGLTDAAWFILFWALAVLCCLIIGIRNNVLLKMNCRRVSFLTGLFVYVVGIFTLTPPMSFYIPWSATLFFLIVCPTSCYIAERLGEAVCSFLFVKL